jgi:hypothetical protein
LPVVAKDERLRLRSDAISGLESDRGIGGFKGTEVVIGALIDKRIGNIGIGFNLSVRRIGIGLSIFSGRVFPKILTRVLTRRIRVSRIEATIGHAVCLDETISDEPVLGPILIDDQVRLGPRILVFVSLPPSTAAMDGEKQDSE